MAKMKGRPKGRPKENKPNMVVVKMEESIVAQAKMIAVARKMSLSEYLSEITRKLVDRDFDRVVRRYPKEDANQ